MTFNQTNQPQSWLFKKSKLGANFWGLVLCYLNCFLHLCHYPVVPTSASLNSHCKGWPPRWSKVQYRMQWDSSKWDISTFEHIFRNKWSSENLIGSCPALELVLIFWVVLDGGISTQLMGRVGGHFLVQSFTRPASDCFAFLCKSRPDQPPIQPNAPNRYLLVHRGQIQYRKRQNKKIIQFRKVENVLIKLEVQKEWWRFWRFMTRFSVRAAISPLSFTNLGNKTWHCLQLSLNFGFFCSRSNLRSDLK